MEIREEEIRDLEKADLRYLASLHPDSFPQGKARHHEKAGMPLYDIEGNAYLDGVSSWRMFTAMPRPNWTIFLKAQTDLIPFHPAGDLSRHPLRPETA